MTTSAVLDKIIWKGFCGEEVTFIRILTDIWELAKGISAGRNFLLEERANAKAWRQDYDGLSKRKGSSVAKGEIAMGGDNETIIQCFMIQDMKRY